MKKNTVHAYPAIDNTTHTVKFINNTQFNFNPAILADVLHDHLSTPAKLKSWSPLIGPAKRPNLIFAVEYFKALSNKQHSHRLAATWL